MSTPEIETVQVLGKDLACLICSHNEFWQREAQLNTGAAELFGLAWANTSAACVICAECGFIHWFHPGQIEK